MESDISQAFQEELTCHICLSCLTDPVTISCGPSFCCACLHLSWEEVELPVHCPVCREPCQKKDFRTNVILKKLVSISRQACLLKYLSSEEHKCVTHKETRTIFCVENSAIVCHPCSDSQEHRGHRHCPIEAAAEGQMERLIKHMASLWEKIQENEDNLEAGIRTMSLWKNYVTLREANIRTEYCKLPTMFYEEGTQRIECIKYEGQTILEKLDACATFMFQKNNKLREMYEELMTKSKEPYVVLLQDLDDTFRRSDALQLCMSQAVKPELSAQPITGLTERFKRFHVQVAFYDADTRHYKMSLFNEIRRLSFGLHHQETPADSEGYYFASRGPWKFISGKYYWEVDVMDSWNWAVGVCKETWLFGRNQTIEPGVFLLVCVKEGSQHSLLTTCPVFHHYLEKPMDRVGILVDCDDGCVSFLNVAKSSLIYSFPPGTFNYPVWPFFSTGHTCSREAVIQYFLNM